MTKLDFYLVIILMTLILGFLARLINKLMRGYIFKYLDIIDPEKNLPGLLTFHWIGSLLLAVILPNNLLNNYIFFQILFEKDEFWIPVTMLCVFFTSLIIIGLLLNIGCQIAVVIFDDTKRNDKI